jgi:hypothetical protein
VDEIEFRFHVRKLTQVPPRQRLFRPETLLFSLLALS